MDDSAAVMTQLRLTFFSSVFLLSLLTGGARGLSVQATLSEEPSEPSQTLLSCGGEAEWFFCVWEGPRGDRLCSVRARQGEEEVKDGTCGHEDPRLQLAGNRTDCQLVISDPAIRDQGDWTCALTDHNMDTVKQVTTLEVVQRGNISLEVSSSGSSVEREEVEIVDGDRLEVNCRLGEVWPAGSLEWSLKMEGEEVEQGELELSLGEEERQADCELCPLTVQQRLSLVLHQQHSGLELTCQHGLAGQTSLRVTVTAPPEADQEQLRHQQSLGLLPGILISSILILLSLAVLVSFCIRTSRNRKPKQADSEDPEVGKSFVENENLVKGGEGAIDMIDNVYDDAIKDNSLTDSSIHSSDSSENNTSDSVSPSDDDKDRPEL